ncbi:uncharacterized protein NECHADRAFT_83487 [Fusarium vanettenii 77-13-4]|uniref:Tyrosinase copper-binding domain-containing protein n=1 Tax=Fusarium vanettenii (strain ATCC MYA-4622 / CBS 123669 / FGSC 9596 / NRRL 45880 / 77-13-4) TaxID=660122 RepID=C7Z456_FUSV7|nr:uncharacterized protein NECHADRAFT_83487 [Fusarium vanettenii 77-13-4]EEU41258.1 hypothetical protein NECHADRAFT_83487 [Fusarium vanettenii 77-13-4]
MLLPIQNLALLAAYAVAVLACPSPANEQPAAKCSQLRVRKECSSEQAAYIDAVQCLKNAPSKGTSVFDTLQSRYDDFVALHINATRGGQDAPSLIDQPPNNGTQPQITIYGVHGVGVFLPWHRYAIWTFESVLRTECNYTGTQPYWDWTLDNPASNGSLFKSPVLKSFGGDGSATNNCVEDGPFTGDTFLNIGPLESLAKNPRCLTRAITEDLFNTSSGWEDIYPPTMSRRSFVQLQAFIDSLDFITEEDKVETGAFVSPHTLGHSVIGGDLMDLYSSPNDPIFWVHHAQLDYLWSLWQKADKSRLADVGGARTLDGFGPSGDKVELTTLDTPLWMGFMNDDVPVKAVMDTINRDGEGVLCYEYEDSPSLAGKQGF